MKKAIFVLFLTSWLGAADLQICYTIPDNAKDEIIEMVSARHPCPTDSAGNKLFTPGQWAKEYYRRLMIREFFAYRRDKKAAEAVNDTSAVQ